MQHNREIALRSAKSEAEELLRYTTAMQAWASDHAPIYVKKLPGSASPDLSGLASRDVEIPGLGEFTMTNPASTLREIAKRGGLGNGGARFVSSKPMSHDNFADEWERSAIASMSSAPYGENPIIQGVGSFRGGPAYRMASALRNSEACEKCHLDKMPAGAVRGAASVHVPMSGILAEVSSMNSADIATHSLAWLLVMVSAMAFMAHDFKRRAAAAEAARLASIGNGIFENMGAAMFSADRNWIITRVNREFSRITGFSEQEVVGKTPSVIKSSRHPDSFYRAIDQELESSGRWSGEIWNRRADGEGFVSLARMFHVEGSDGLVERICSFTDVTSSLSERDEIVRIANYDPLTGLPNKNLFIESLRLACARARRQGGKVFVIVLRCSNSTRIRDVFGHQIFDETIVAVASRLSGRARKSDIVARTSQDSFSILCETQRFNEDSFRPEALAKALADACNEPVETRGGSDVVAGAVAGISDALANESAEGSVDAAEAASDRADDSNRVEFFDPDAADKARRLMATEAALGKAVSSDEIRAFFQPQASVTEDGTVRVKGAEALARWIAPGKPPVPPMEFIPLAESNGMIVRIGESIFEQAASMAKEMTCLAPGSSMAINVSSRQLERPEFLNFAISSSHRAGGPGCLELEITETCAMDRGEVSIRNIEGASRAGFSIALDDFGTGYSSLSLLSTIPASRLKIDKSFVMNIGDAGSESIIRSVTALANASGMKVTAEGVETAEQAAFLFSCGIRDLQGYWISKPLSPTDFVSFLSSFKGAPGDHAERLTKELAEALRNLQKPLA